MAVKLDWMTSETYMIPPEDWYKYFDLEFRVTETKFDINTFTESRNETYLDPIDCNTKTNFNQL